MTGVWIALLAFLGVYTLPARISPPSASPGPEKPVADSRDRPIAGTEPSEGPSLEWVRILQPLEDFRGLDLAKVGQGAEDKIESLLRDGGHCHLDLMIAAVPDPTLFAGRDWFDTAVDAIQRAAEAQGFVLDRYRLPQAQLEPLPAGTTRILVGRQPPPKAGVGAPGLVLFRGESSRPADSPAAAPRGLPPCSDSDVSGSTQEAPRRPSEIYLLGIFLVPESPTTGLDKPALKAAFSIISKHQQINKLLPLPIRVVGPNFSGSQSSMELAMAEWLQSSEGRSLVCRLSTTGDKPAIAFDWCSGAATSIDIGRFDRGDLSRKVRFHATAHKSEQSDAAMLAYVAERLGTTVEQLTRPDSPPAVALLVEANTEYGNDVMGQFGRNPARTDGKRTDANRGNQDRRNVFPFPMRISHLRAAYFRQEAVAGATGMRLPTVEKLPQAFEGGGHNDVLPSNSPESSASNDELAISQTLAQIRRRRFTYVAILATEREDTLFLARLVRHHCPDSRLILFNIASAYWHPENIRALRGSVVVSDYPLSLRNQNWSYPYRGEFKQLVMPTEWAQGTYNATTFQLCEVLAARAELASRWGEQALLEYGPPFDEIDGKVRPSLRGVGGAQGRTTWGSTVLPPVWISVVGQHGFYPLKAVWPESIGDGTPNGRFADYLRAPRRDGSDGDAFRPQTRAQRLAPVLHESWRAAFLVATAVLTMVFGGYLAAYLAIGFVGLAVPTREVVNATGWGARALRWMEDLVGPESPRAANNIFAAHRSTRRAFRGLLVFQFAVLTLAYAALCWPVLLPYRVDSQVAAVSGRHAGFAMLVLTGSLVTLLASAWMLMHTHEERGSLRRHSGWVLATFVAVAAATASLLAKALPPVDPGQRVSSLLFSERAMALTSGVSPIMPILLLGGAVLVWSMAIASRLRLAGRVTPRFPLAEGRLAIPPLIGRQARALRRGINPFVSGLGTMAWWAWVAPFVAGLIPLVNLWGKVQPSLEPRWYDLCFWTTLSGLLLLVWLGLLDLFAFWAKLRGLLRLLVSLPMPRALDRLPTRVGAQFGQPRPPFAAQGIALSERQLDAVLAGFPPVATDLERLLMPEASLMGRLSEAARRTGRRRPRVSLTRDLVQLISPLWERRPVAAAFGDPRADQDRPNSPSSSPYWGLIGGTAGELDDPAALGRWLDQVEDLVALSLVEYVNSYFAHLWDLIAALTTTPLLLFLAVTSYPFLPMRYCLGLLGSTILVEVGLFGFIFVQMNRNEFVSRISNTTPNRLTMDRAFVFNLVKFVLPLLAILIAVSTDLSDLIHSWVDPVLEMFG